jgi:hypothetical protein
MVVRRDHLRASGANGGTVVVDVEDAQSLVDRSEITHCSGPWFRVAVASKGPARR